MKKVVLFVAVISAFSFASCKKDRVCTCTGTWPGATANVTTYTKSTKAGARANCLSSTQTNAGVTYTENCDLK